MYRSSDVGPRLIQGWCCSTEANSVEASAPSSLSRTWRYSSGICSTVSTFRIPRRTPHSTARDTDTGAHLLRRTAAGAGPSIRHAPVSRLATSSGIDLAWSGSPCDVGRATHARPSQPVAHSRDPTELSRSTRYVWPRTRAYLERTVITCPYSAALPHS